MEDTKLNWTEEAKLWLHEIHKYIALDNPLAAEQVVLEIFATAQLLITFPDIGFLYRANSEGEIRILLHGHYRIAYLKKWSLREIDVLGVFHGALDMARHLLI